MTFIDKVTSHDICVYWALRSRESGGLAYDNYGQPQYTDPVEILCRWDDMAEEYIDPKGTRRISKAKVMVREDLDIGGMLFHGDLTEVTEPDDPRAQDGAWEIRQFKKVPNLSYRWYFRQAYL